MVDDFSSDECCERRWAGILWRSQTWFYNNDTPTVPNLLPCPHHHIFALPPSVTSIGLVSVVLVGLEQRLYGRAAYTIISLALYYPTAVVVRRCIVHAVSLGNSMPSPTSTVAAAIATSTPNTTVVVVIIAVVQGTHLRIVVVVVVVYRRVGRSVYEIVIIIIIAIIIIIIIVNIVVANIVSTLATGAPRV